MALRAQPSPQLGGHAEPLVKLFDFVTQADERRGLGTSV